MSSTLRFAYFGIKEDLSGLGSTFFTLLLFPIICFVMALTWQRINPSATKMSLAEVFAYVSMTEMLFMSMLRGAVFQKAQGDFSRSLAYPRNWLLMNGAQFYGRSVARRVLLISVFLCAFPFVQSAPSIYGLEIVARIFPLILLLSFFDVLYTLALCLLYLVWEKTHHVRFLVGKFFLVFGGVLIPVSEVREPWKAFLLASPMADLFFQPAHFALNGSFYGFGATQWLFRLLTHGLVLLGVVFWMFGWARRKHQSFGG